MPTVSPVRLPTYLRPGSASITLYTLGPLAISDIALMRTDPAISPAARPRLDFVFEEFLISLSRMRLRPDFPLCSGPATARDLCGKRLETTRSYVHTRDRMTVLLIEAKCVASMSSTKDAIVAIDIFIRMKITFFSLCYDINVVSTT